MFVTYYGIVKSAGESYGKKSKLLRSTKWPQYMGVSPALILVVESNLDELFLLTTKRNGHWAWSTILVITREFLPIKPHYPREVVANYPFL